MAALALTPAEIVEAILQHDRWDSDHRKSLAAGSEHRKRQDSQIRDLKERIGTLEEALELTLRMIADIQSAIDNNDRLGDAKPS